MPSSKKSLFGLVILTFFLVGCARLGMPRAPFLPPTKETVTRTTLKVGLIQPPQAWDPALAEALSERQIAAQVYEGLLSLDRNGQLQPALAEQWEVSAGGKQITFFLRQGVRFHSGRMMTAANVKTSWERILDPGTRSPWSSIFLSVIGAKAKLAGKPGTVEGIQTKGDYQVILFLEQPDPALLPALASPAAGIMDLIPALPSGLAPSAAPAEVFPAGAGPFRLAEWLAGESATLVKNPYYYGTQPASNRLEFVIEPDLDTAIVDFKGGDLDLILDSPTIFSVAENEQSLLPQLQASPLQANWYLGFNLWKNLWQDVRMRRAIAYLIDHKNLDPGLRGQPLNTVIPAQLMGPDITTVVFQPNSFLSQVLLTTAGYKPAAAAPVNLFYFNEEVDEKTAKAVASQMEGQGLRVSLLKGTRAEFRQGINSGAIDLFIFRWLPPYPDPLPFFAQFTSGEITRRNLTGYSSPEIDGIISYARQTSGDERAGLFRRAGAAIAQEVPVVPLWQGPVQNLVNRSLSELDFNWQGIPSLQNVILP